MLFAIQTPMHPTNFAQTIRQGLGTLSVSALLVSIPTQVQAAAIVSEWKPIFEGIEFATGTDDDPAQQVNSFRIDLSSPGIRFFSTPDNGVLPEETIAQTTSQFLDEFDLQVAVNANFFAPCCDPMAESKDLIGLAISDGDVVSPSDDMVSGNISLVPDSLLITGDNQATIASTRPRNSFSNVFTAVSAGPRLLIDGEIVVPQTPPDAFSNLNPRTAVGLSEEEQFLILMTIDGRQPGISEGATLFQTAEWLTRFGSFQGLNLDGGGSTTIVREDEFGDPLILNTPSSPDGVERFNGNNLGVFANPLADAGVSVPEPSTVVLLIASSVYLVWRRTKRVSAF